MPSWVSEQIDKFRGTLRVGERPVVPAPAPRAPSSPSAPMAPQAPGDPGVVRDIDSTQSGRGPAGESSSILDDYKKLIPGEALAAYVALQAVAEKAENPGNVRIVLALACCLLTVFLRWVGTQDKATRKPQYGAVLFAAVAFILLVYAAGGQVFWHPRFPDQQYYAQIIATILGVAVPILYRRSVPTAG